MPQLTDYRYVTFVSHLYVRTYQNKADDDNTSKKRWWFDET